VALFLGERSLLRGPEAGQGSTRLLVTDVPKTFDETATRFLGAHAGPAEQIDL